MSGASVSRSQALSLAERFIQINKELLGNPPPGREFQQALTKAKLGIFRLVVVGEIKKGKSSFINALLGEQDLLPTSSDVATSTVYKIMYGPARKAKVFFIQPPGLNKEKPHVIEIALEQLPEYGTEDGNPGNKKGVDFIGIELPSAMLRKGLVIIDTPGLGGLFREHAEITWRYIPSADAVFFVLDSVESVMTRDEREFLGKIRRMTPLIFFIQTKVDLVDENQWRQWRERNVEIIARELQMDPKRVPYFPVSSQLKLSGDKQTSIKHLERSGFQRLLSFLNGRLIETKDSQLSLKLLGQVNHKLQEAGAKTRDLLRVASASSSEELAKLEKEFQETKQKLEEWRKDAERMFQDYRAGLAEIKQWVQSSISSQFDPAPSGKVVHTIMDSVRKSDPDPKKLNENVGIHQTLCADQCNQALVEIYAEVQERLRLLTLERCESLIQTMTTTMDAPDTDSLLRSLTKTENLNMRFSRFEDLRTRCFGGMFGGLAGEIVVSAAGAMVTAIFPPAAAVLLYAPFIGVGLGAVLADTDAKAKKQEEALQKLQGAIIDTVRQVQHLAIRQAQEIFTRIDKQVTGAFREAAERQKSEIEERIKAVAQAKQHTVGESRANKTQLEHHLRRIMALRSQIMKAVGSPTQ